MDNSKNETIETGKSQKYNGLQIDNMNILTTLCHGIQNIKRELMYMSWEENTVYPIYTFEDYKEKIDNTFKIYGKKTAITRIVENGIERKLTYAEMLEKLEELEKVLLEVNVKRAERVAVVTKPTAEAVVLNFGLAYLGYTAVLIDAALPQEEQNKLLEYADVNVVFTTVDVYEQMDCEIKGKVPVFEIKKDFSYRIFRDSIRKCIKKNIEPCHEDVIAIIFSSGTTAEMKGIMVTYNSILYAQKYIVQYANLNSKASFLDILPSNHIAGYSSSMSCLLTGAEVGFVEEINAEKMLSGFLNFNPTNFIMIPKVYEVIKNKIEVSIDKKALLVKWYAKTAMKLCGSVREKTGINLRLLTKPIWKLVFGKKIRMCGCGTLQCSEEIIKFYLDLGINFLNVYGATETGFPITAANCNEKYPTKGAGNINQFKEIKVVICEPDADGIGEIRVKTPLIMKGYFREDELTKQAFDENGYFKTGDLGYIDSEGYLYVTGRIKEVIVLHNGKKVSPIDVDKYYQSIMPDITMASCGISTKEGYDSICLLVEKGKRSESEMNSVLVRLKEASAKSSLYMVDKVMIIDKIPVTSVGKVKRFLLKKYSEEMEEMNETQRDKGPNEDINNGNIEQKLLMLISKYSTGIEATMESNLKNELGIDSLNMFELCMEIEDKLGISIVNRLDDIVIVRDILSKDNGQDCREKNYLVNDFLQKRKSGDFRYIRRFGHIGRLIYGMEVIGFENIPKNESILLCPNHESYLDAMWVASALLNSGYSLEGFCCLAAEHLKKKWFMKKAFRALGGIPVARGGNTALAMKRAKECLTKQKCCMLIHPEGTRTRSGKLGEFKQGAAKLAIETGVKIVPVCINGAYEIFPPSSRLPRLLDWKRLRRYSMQINFGPVIDPAGKSEKEMTQIVRDFVVEQKKLWG